MSLPLRILVGLFPLALVAQSVHIEGIIVDAVSGVPIGGAKAVLHYATSPAALDTATTEASGTFQLSAKEPGRYTVEVSAPGFEETIYRGAGNPIEFSAAQFEAGAGDTTRNIVVKIARSGGLRGVIRDADTHKPIPLVTVRALRSWWLRGVRQLKQEDVGFTDEDGIFELFDLPVGDYVLEIDKADSSHSSAPEASSKRYPLVFWPDNDPDNISWLHLTGGGETDVGSIDYAKAEPVRIRGVIASGCPPANGGIGSLDRKVGGAFVPQPQSDFVCRDGSFPIPVRAAGIYRLLRFSVGDRASTVAAEFKAVEGDNPDVDVKPAELSGIRGSVTCECQAPFVAGPERTGLSLNPVFLNAGLFGSFDFNADGAFEGEVALSGPALVQFLNLPDGLFVKRISLNGKETGPVVNVLPGSSVSIEVTLSDTPATLSGTVVRQDKPAAHTYVVAVPWPMRMEDGYPDFVTSQAGDNGEFIVGNLPPGTYKVVSVGPAEWSHKDEPNVVESWLASGNEITLAEKESRTVRLESKLQ